MFCVSYGKGPRNPSRAAIDVIASPRSSSGPRSPPGGAAALTRVPAGVVPSATAKGPTATPTSRAAGAVDVQVRRPPFGCDGAAGVPVITTAISAGADTEIRVSAAGLVAVSPFSSTNGSRAQPTPGSQA